MCHQFVRTRWVGVGVAATKIDQRLRVDDGAFGRPQLTLKNRLGIGAAHRRHGVKAQAKTTLKQTADGTEIKAATQHLCVIMDRVNDFDHRTQHAVLAQVREGNRVADRLAISMHQLAALKHRLGQVFRRRAAIGDVVFDAKVSVWPPGVVAGRQHQAAAGAALPNHR